MELIQPGAQGCAGLPRRAGPCAEPDSAAAGVEALYQRTALGLIRLAYVMLDDLPAAEDVVQEAFFGLYRRWDGLKDPDSAVYYLRASVLNGCRSVLRRMVVRRRGLPEPPPAASAEAAVLGSEERAELIRALRRLPRRQREVLVLRYYADLPDDEVARVLGIGPSTVRSTAHRAVEALGRALKAGTS
ncbi:MAG TPA: SigE family RNA polymerase sigma factor [Streptosporangiaceae bacterium]|jgi:RNA polymerase sigma-70 factor (sigma-E family)